MLGTVIGDIVGSRFKDNNERRKQFDFLTYKCSITNSSVMSLAIAKTLLESQQNYSDLSKRAIKNMQGLAKHYPDFEYDVYLKEWIYSNSPSLFENYGDSVSIHASPCGFVANSIKEVKKLSKVVSEITHNRPEDLKGAEATAVAIYLARSGKNLLEIRDYITNNYYQLNFTLDDIRNGNKMNESCKNIVPQALEAFFESNNFEDAIRNAISLGGKSDIRAAITGGIAGAYYGISTDIRKHALTFLNEDLLEIIVNFENKYPPKMEKLNANVSVGILRNNENQIETGGRNVMIQSSMEMADIELKNSLISSEETSSQRLFNHLFEACNILRGPINQDEYKSYVTPILFFKRISDVYDEETQDALERSGGDKEYASFPENHSFDIPEGCHWQDVREASENVGVAIVRAMNGIERANPDTLSGVFSSFDDANWTDKTKLSDERLKNLIEHMSQIKVGNTNYSSDVMGDSYEFLIKKFADLSKKNAGEFYTPRSIVKLLIMLMDPKVGETVYDPACGTGGMLIEAIRYLKDDKLTYGRIYGQEKNLSTSAIARMNLFLHGAKDFNVTQGDTLRSPNYHEGGKLKTFDCVVANPPFSLKNWGSEQFSSDIYGRNIWGSPTNSNADYAWLQHMVKSMNHRTGRCAVVLPQGVLFRGGKEGEIRKQLIDSDKLECVITLVGGVFYSTGVSACILLLNNNKKTNHKGRICMIDASDIYTAKRAQNIMTDDDISKVFQLYNDYTDVVEKVKVVTISDIKEKEYTLAINNYIENKEQELISPDEVRMQYFKAFDEMLEAEDELKSLLLEGGYVNE